MFQFLRSKAKIFYWVIAVSFILFGVVFSYGGATGGCQNDGPSANHQAGIIGKVNGQSFTGAQYEQVYSQLLNYARTQSQGRELNANQTAGMRRQAWNQIVQELLVNDAIAEYGIEVTDEELKNRFETNPPPALLNNYRNPETGVVDMNAYYADLQNPENDWSGPEQYVRKVMETEKLQNIIAADVVVSAEDVRQEYLAQTGKAMAEYMGVLYSDLESDYSPTDEEMQAYYQSHLDDFQRQEKVEAEVVRWAKEASESDWNSALEELNEIKAEIESGAITFADAAIRYSEDGSANSGGDLGTFDRNRMVPEFTEVAFSLPVGTISDPVKTKFGYHLIEVTEQHNDEETNELYQVTARHILLKVAPGNNTLAMLEDSAQEFADRVDGSSFLATAEAEAQDHFTPDAFIEGRDIPGLPLSMAGSLWAHSAKPGSVSPVFSNRDFYYVVLAGERIPAGPAEFDEVKSQVELALTKENNKKLASAQLSPVVGEVQMGRPLSEAADNAGLKHAVTDTFTYNGNVAEVGFGTDFNKKAIEGTVGTLIPEVETLRGLYALIPTWIAPFDEEDFSSRQDGIRLALLNQAQNEKVNEFFKERLEAAEIEDFRY